MKHPFEVVFSAGDHGEFKALCSTWSEVEHSVETYGASNLLCIQTNHLSTAAFEQASSNTEKTCATP